MFLPQVNIMHKFRPSLQKILVNISIILIVAYIVLFVGVSVLANIILFDANNYKQQIEQAVAKRTHYILHIDSINSRFNYDYLPEITLNGVAISNKDTPNQKLEINQLVVNLSYSSLWNLELIFNKIAISNTTLNIAYDKNGDVTLNGMLITNLHKRPSHGASFDVETWLLKQHNLLLNGINLSVVDNKNNLNLVDLKNINIIYNNSLFSDKHLQITVNNQQAINHLFLDLVWNGNKFEQLKQWRYARLTLKTANNSSIFTRNLQQYFPQFGFIKKYTSNTAIDALLEDGHLSNLTANLNLSDLSYAFANNDINFPQIRGVVNIRLDKKTQRYSIKAESMQITTTDGAILENKSVNGYYIIDKSGTIEAFDSNLNGINNLLHKFNATKELRLFGQIQHIKLSWLGNIFQPQSYLLELNFHNLGLSQPNSQLPQIDHVSGNATITNNAGKVTLSIESSNFIYSPLFYIPYTIKHLRSNISWQINTDKTIAVNLESAVINAADFTASAHGRYTYVPNTSGYLALYARLESIPASKVGYYLPKSIDNANQWLQTALVGGYGESATLTLEGWLKDFPFAKNTGKFYIDATINNGKLRYIPNWPTIDDVNGKFMIRNEKIIITADNAKVNGNSLAHVNAVIPNMLAEHSYLEATGDGFGTTQNFIHYLSQTPINKLLDNLPKLTKAQGAGTVKLYLKVPFSNPDATTVNGTYNFLANRIEFSKLPLPAMTNTSGNLDFSNHGLEIKNISANALGGTINLSATTSETGKMLFQARSQSLNFQQLIQFYLTPLSPIISGNGDANIKFVVSQKGLESLNASSNLKYVHINAPKPLSKNTNNETSVNFSLNNLMQQGYSIAFNYESALSGSIKINNSGQLVSSNIIMGKNESSTTHLPAILTLSAQSESFELVDWLTTMEKTFLNKSDKSTAKHSQKHELATTSNKQSSVYPIDVQLATNNLTISALAFGRANAHVHVNDDKVVFNLSANQLDGYGVYLLGQNQLNLTAYFLSINHQFGASATESGAVRYTIPYILESGVIATALEESNFDRLLDENAYKANVYANSLAKNLNLPYIKANIKQLYLNGNDAGSVSFVAKTVHNNLVIDNALWQNNYAKYKFNLTDYCHKCVAYNSLVDTRIQAQIFDLGKLLASLNINGLIAQTSGKVDIHAQWRGSTDDFSLKSSAIKMNLELKNGRFLKVDTGSVLGGIIGIINLQTLVNLVSLNFRDIFANGFAFNDLTATAYLVDNVLHLKYFYMASSIAVVALKGTINLNNNTLSMYLNVTPRLGIGVAVGAGIITLNPLVGVATYLAELALQNPVNKLFAFTFYLSGNIRKPEVKQIGISKQLTNNISSTVGR